MISQSDIKQGGFTQNVFTFDDDDEDQISSSLPYERDSKNINFHCPKFEEGLIEDGKAQKNEEIIDSGDADVFVFDDDQNEDFKQQTEISRQIELQKEKKKQQNRLRKQSGQDQFNDLKNKILFRSQDNFIKNKIDTPVQNNQKLDAFLRQPKPMTTNFEKKVKKVRESIKENQDLPQKVIDSSSKNIINKQKNQKKKRSSQLQSHFQQFKQSKNFQKQQQQSYKIQGAKILRDGQCCTKQQFEYVQSQRAIKVTNMKQFLFTQLSQEYRVNILIKKANQGFLDKLVNRTKYFITIEQNNKFLFSVTRDGLNKFIFSMNKDDVSQGNKNYLGQLVGKNLSNSEMVLYDYGFDPKETKCLEYSFKELAWIKYEESYGPRKFSVVMATNDQGFYCIESNSNVIQKKWDNKKDRRNLCKLYTKQPEFDESDGAYKLDFKGMMGKPSIKNFVLSSEEHEDCLMFARRTDDTYALQVKHPFSLMQAVAVCISSIHHKTVL